MNNFLIIAIVTALALVVGYVSSLYLGKDNAIEQECEKIIKDETGQQIDISGPDAPPTDGTTK